MSDKHNTVVWKERFETLETRQRFLILFIIISVMFLIFFLFVFDPVSKRMKQHHRQIAEIELKKSDVDNDRRQLDDSLNGALINSKRQQLKTLDNQIKQLDISFSKYADLVSPGEMSKVLKEIFQSSKALKLISLEKKPIQIAFNEKELSRKELKELESDNNKDAFHLYKHAFTVTLKGSYFDLINALKTIEKKKLKLYWEGLNYQVKQYPNADIQITLFTFSYHKNWIGRS